MAKLFSALLVFLLLFVNTVNAQEQEVEENTEVENSMFSYKKDSVEEVSENYVGDSNISHIDLSMYDEQRKQLIRETIEQSIIEMLFYGNDPRKEDINEEYGFIDFSGSRVVGSAEDKYLVLLSNGETKLVNKDFYNERRHNLNNVDRNSVIEELREGAGEVRRRVSGENIEEEIDSAREIRTRGEG